MSSAERSQFVVNDEIRRLYERIRIAKVGNPLVGGTPSKK